jgi:N-acetylglucosamine malate deacetylase 1
MINEIDILAIFAHPDDVELTVGGTLLKMKFLGYKTGALDVTRGEMGTRGTAEGRAREAEEAAKILKTFGRISNCPTVMFLLRISSGRKWCAFFAV